MFEQSTLTSPPASKRLWATCLGVTGQVVLVGSAMLAPMLWPQILPPVTLMTALVAPGPPPPPRGPVVRPRPTQATHRMPIFNSSVVYQPTSFIPHAQTTPDPPQIETGDGVVGSVGRGTPGGSPDGLLGGILRDSAAPVPVRVHEPPHVAAPEPAAVIQRVRVGGNVKMAAILHRVEPVYPQIAKQMRVAGTVELRGVIGTDGHLREVTLVSGHPLLARAAIEAVSQWIYAPTQLNDVPVEVIAPITVTFRLN